MSEGESSNEEAVTPTRPPVAEPDEAQLTSSSWGQPPLAVCESLGLGEILCDTNQPCASGSECVVGGCDGLGVCVRSGIDCAASASICPESARCDALEVGSVCVSTVPGCVDGRTCPVGHRCETVAGDASPGDPGPDGDGGGTEGTGAEGPRVCVDRRLVCAEAGAGGCPASFECVPSTGARPECLFAMDSCNDTACFSGECLDTKGDGMRYCFPPEGECSSDAECDEGRCGVSPVTGMRACGAPAPCEDGDDCDAGEKCEDTHGTGTRLCVPVLELCRGDEDCFPGSLCFDHDLDGTRSCVCFDSATGVTSACPSKTG